ncbi:MAG: amino acid permease [Burkholderiales bacterium]|nr:amino acid permease [Burkholderiales bacterium]
MSKNLKQRLESRHINMIAIGGSIGTGIFLASGYAIFVGGPGGALLAYAVMAIIVYFLMTSLGEMSTYRPSSGSFCDYSNLYVGKSFGFAMGYNYWLNWAITIAAEISAATLIMNFWYPHANPVWFSLLFFIGIVIANLFSVKIYGEVEYWLSFVKVAVIIVFIVLGIATLIHQPQFGATKWTIGDAPFHQGWFGFKSVFLFAGYSFQGTELVGVASGETKEPEKSIPRAIKLVFWRLTLFYILSIGVISLLIAYNNPQLASQDNVHMSPYTLVFSNYIGSYAATFINLVILLALISAANASMYSATRILWYLGKTKQAPQFITTVNNNGVPLNSLIITAIIGSVVFVSSIIGNGVVFTYLVQISSLCGFLAWFGIALSHYKFRKNILPKLGGINTLKYRAKFYPFAQIISMVVIVAIMIAQFITLGKHYTFFDFIMIYSSVILFFILYFGHKIYTKTHQTQDL